MPVLVLNGGSSSTKCAIYEASGDATVAGPRCLAEGELSGVGSEGATLKVADLEDKNLEPKDQQTAIELTLGAAEKALGGPPAAVGDRVVHPGPKLHGHQRSTPEVLTDLEQGVEFAPLHDPEALQPIWIPWAEL
jgi:acetate kinase